MREDRDYVCKKRRLYLSSPLIAQKRAERLFPRSVTYKARDKPGRKPRVLLAKGFLLIFMPHNFSMLW